MPAPFSLFNSHRLVSHPRPTRSYAEAVQRFEALKAKDTPAVNPLCHSQLITHGQKVARVIVFIHGFTNCPQQFCELGQRFYNLGYNVLIGRLPYHGLSNRVTPELGKLTAEQIAAFTDELVDIGLGLGEQVTLGGLSGGGVAAAWAFQMRPDVSRAVSIAPSFALKNVPLPLMAPLTRLALSLPNFFVWWNQSLKANTKPDYAYPRFSTRALAEVIRLGYAVKDAARQSKPAGGKFILITNGNDVAVENQAVYQIAEAWQRHGATGVRYEFEVSLNLIHDIIDPTQPEQRVDLVYPKLIDLIDSQ